MSLFTLSHPKSSYYTDIYVIIELLKSMSRVLLNEHIFKKKKTNHLYRIHRVSNGNLNYFYLILVYYNS